MREDFRVVVVGGKYVDKSTMREGLFEVEEVVGQVGEAVGGGVLEEVRDGSSWEVGTLSWEVVEWVSDGEEGKDCGVKGGVEGWERSKEVVVEGRQILGQGCMAGALL